MCQALAEKGKWFCELDGERNTFLSSFIVRTKNLDLALQYLEKFGTVDEFKGKGIFPFLLTCPSSSIDEVLRFLSHFIDSPAGGEDLADVAEDSPDPVLSIIFKVCLSICCCCAEERFYLSSISWH